MACSKRHMSSVSCALSTSPSLYLVRLLARLALLIWVLFLSSRGTPWSPCQALPVLFSRHTRHRRPPRSCTCTFSVMRLPFSLRSSTMAKKIRVGPRTLLGTRTRKQMTSSMEMMMTRTTMTTLRTSAAVVRPN